MSTYNLFLKIEPIEYTIESNNEAEAIAEAKIQFAKTLRIGDVTIQVATVECIDQ